MKPIDQHETGIFPEHAEAEFLGGPIRKDSRMTVPAREAFEKVNRDIGDPLHYNFPTPPTGVIAVYAPAEFEGAPIGGLTTAYRLEDESPFPGEIENHGWDEIMLAPCPKCGAALVWYEAGYVPGYRVCAGKNHHHFCFR